MTTLEAHARLHAALGELRRAVAVELYRLAHRAFRFFHLI